MSDTTHSQHPAGGDPIHPLEQQRRQNRDAVAALGLDVYGQREEGLRSLADAHALYDEAADAAHQQSEAARKDARKANPAAAEGDLPPLVDTRPVVKVAGRVVLHRDGGKLIWMNLRDETRETFQIAVSKADCSERGFAVAKSTDLGDLLVAEGPLMRTKAGEVTVWCREVRPASKCLVPPPEKRLGLADVEARYRQRYVDLWSNPESMRVFQARTRLMSEVRRFLEGRGFVEVETPMLQAQAGGAAARPFVTHMNALDMDLYLRIAPELYLKRLLVGGMPRVFEINRNFRNEGVSPRHNPEFTMMELYEAYGDYMSMAEVTESLIRRLAGVAGVAGGREGGEGGSSGRVGSESRPTQSGGSESRPTQSTKIAFGDVEIDYGRAFEFAPYEALFERGVGCSMFDEAAVRAAAPRHGVKPVNDKGVAKDHWLLVGELFELRGEALIEKHRPTFVIDYPAALCPLTKSKRERPEIAERFELYIGGMEVANAYTELNDPDVQAAKFREQLAGIEDEESTFRNFDEDFIRALKVGMPPAGGLGIGIDRVCMLMTGQGSIRDVILFPLLRSAGAGAGAGAGEGA